MATHARISIGDRVNAVNFWKCMISYSIYSSKSMSSFLLIVMIGIACGIIAEQPQNAAALATQTGIIVPLYIYPGEVWDDLIKEKIHTHQYQLLQ